MIPSDNHPPSLSEEDRRAVDALLEAGLDHRLILIACILIFHRFRIGNSQLLLLTVF